jgi:hypothetical protein
MKSFVILDDEHWIKTGPFSTIDLERRIYESLGPHPHIVPYRPVNAYGELGLQRISKGPMHTLLENDSNVDTIQCAMSYSLFSPNDFHTSDLYPDLDACVRIRI